MNNEKIKSQPKKAKKPSYIQVLGPVENLESYVKADWWKEIFNANYLRTDGDVVEDVSITQQEIDLFINILHPNKNDFILDLCCGQGRHTLEMSRREYSHLYGLDRSHYLINRAKSINKKEGLNVTFREGDARKVPLATDTFNFVIIAGNSFGYFESANDDKRVLEEVKRVLQPYGKVLIDLTDGNYMRKNFQPRSWEWIDKNYFVCRERSLSDDQKRLISREVISHVKKGVIADQFYAERLYTKNSIETLLQNIGFSDIQFHQELRPDSQRNQDLGMMAQRILVSSSIKKEWTVKRKPKQTTKTIVVAMGDPNRTDPTKPNSIFDEDDFYTINELKKALLELEDYNFIYLDAHNTLIYDLQNKKNKIDFVFNLCDEGLNNDPTQELHVPSLLEILNIPYSGGNPQCLAYCYDKSLVRGVAKEMDIPVPEAFIIEPEDVTYIELQIGFPVIVKPNFGDSSFGITKNSVCNNVEELENAITSVREKFGYNKPIIAEQFLTGKDISVGIIGNPPESYQVLPIIEEDYSVLPPGLPRICGYEAKWNPDSPYWKITSIPADLAEETLQFLVASCVKLFTRLGCRDYARFDWRLDNNQTPRLLEVNPNPGWCWDGHLAKMAKLAGMNYSEMLAKILQAAEERIQSSNKEVSIINNSEGISKN